VCAPEEAKTYDVALLAVGDSKIMAIKVTRDSNPRFGSG